MKSWKIYLHKNKINGLCYVGQTSQTLAQRWGRSGGQYKGQKFYDAIIEFGWDNFDHILLEDNIKTVTDADKAERKWIAYYNSYYNGYNENLGGGGTNNFSEEAIQKISESSKERWQNSEYRQFMSKMHSETSSKAVRCINNGIIYKSAKDAAIATGDPTGKQGSSIGQVCNGKREFANGLQWEWVDNPKEKKSDIDGLYFVLDGRFKIGRERLKQDIINQGGYVREKISFKTNYVITNNSCTGSKTVDAKKAGIPILTEEDFISKFGSD